MENNFQTKLFNMQDIRYRNFQAKLMPTVDINKIIGVRTPDLRKFAKDIFDSKDAEIFLSKLPHEFYEENNLHGYLIEMIKDFDKAIDAINIFLPYIDNWATCDSICPKVFKRNTDKLLPHAMKWIEANHTYTVRYGIGMLMRFFLDDKFDEIYPNIVAAVKSDEYYINMMRAWYFATALAKQYDAILPILQNSLLDNWTHNKTIQKAIESYRITDSQKQYLKNLKTLSE